LRNLHLFPSSPSPLGVEVSFCFPGHGRCAGLFPSALSAHCLPYSCPHHNDEFRNLTPFFFWHTPKVLDLNCVILRHFFFGGCWPKFRVRGFFFSWDLLEVFFPLPFRSVLPESLRPKPGSYPLECSRGFPTGLPFLVRLFTLIVTCPSCFLQQSPARPPPSPPSRSGPR